MPKPPHSTSDDETDRDKPNRGKPEHTEREMPPPKKPDDWKIPVPGFVDPTLLGGGKRRP